MENRTETVVAGELTCQPAKDQRVVDDCEPAQWRVIAEVATSVAPCRTYEELVTTVAHVLRSPLQIEAVAYFALQDHRFELAAASGGDAWLQLRGDLAGLPLRDARVSSFTGPDCEHVVACPVRYDGDVLGYLCLARSRELEANSRALLDPLVSHLSSAVVNVRNHVRARTHIEAIAATVMRPGTGDADAQLRDVRRSVSDLMDIARAEDGTLVCQLTAMRIDTLLRDTLDAVASPARRNNVVLQCTIEEPELNAAVDPALMRRVLDNIVSASIAHAPGGHVRIRAGREGLRAVIEVSHDGQPMPAAALVGQFAPYGVGLVFSWYALTRQGGTIEVVNREGGGVRFIVTVSSHVAAPSRDPGVSTVRLPAFERPS